jgi:hypothetical protein
MHLDPTLWISHQAFNINRLRYTVGLGYFSLGPLAQCFHGFRRAVVHRLIHKIIQAFTLAGMIHPMLPSVEKEPCTWDECR